MWCHITGEDPEFFQMEGLRRKRKVKGSRWNETFEKLHYSSWKRLYICTHKKSKTSIIYKILSLFSLFSFVFVFFLIFFIFFFIFGLAITFFLNINLRKRRVGDKTRVKYCQCTNNIPPLYSYSIEKPANWPVWYQHF